MSQQYQGVHNKVVDLLSHFQRLHTEMPVISRKTTYHCAIKRFQFDGGDIFPSTVVYTLPAQVGELKFKVVTHVVSLPIPLLFSKAALKICWGLPRFYK